jgi:hypothetical protein
MSTVTSRAKDYGLPDVSCNIDDVGVSPGTDNIFMGPVTLHTLTARFEKSSGLDWACYLKVYDSLSPKVGAGLADPLWILQCRSGETFTMSFPDGYTFTNGISLRATRAGGSGTPGDLAPEGITKVTLLGRKS